MPPVPIVHAEMRDVEACQSLARIERGLEHRAAADLRVCERKVCQSTEHARGTWRDARRGEDRSFEMKRADCAGRKRRDGFADGTWLLGRVLRAPPYAHRAPLMCESEGAEGGRAHTSRAAPLDQRQMR